MQRYLSFSLRGAIGIQEGIGAEQVDVDMSSFQPGLVAIVGDNGRGKSTLIENLHEYRRMVSYEGKLEDAFYLKDSWRIIKKEIDGDIYEFKILIDGLSGNSEPYIYKNGRILSKDIDGKKGPYDKEIIKLFGSEDLYFNTVFAGQKSSGFAKLKWTDRRAIFYELLRYIKYEKLCRQQKDICKEEERKLATLEGEIRIIKDDVDSFANTEAEINEKRLEEQKLKFTIDQTEAALESTRRGIQDKKIELSKAEEIEKNNQSVSLSIDEKKVLKFNIEKEQAEELQSIETEEQIRVNEFEKNNEYAKKISELSVEEERELKAEKLQTSTAWVEKEKIELGIKEVEEDKTKNIVLVARYEKILNNKSLIEQKLTQKKTLTDEINLKLEKERGLLQQVTELQQSEKKEKEELKQLQDTATHLAKETAQAKSNWDVALKERENLVRYHNQTMETINEAIATITKVPCTPEIGNQCMFLRKAYENERVKESVMKKFEEEEASLDSHIEDLIRIHGQFNKKYIEAQAQVDNKEREIAHRYNGSFSKLKSDREELTLNIKEIAGKLAEINKSKWEELKIEAEKAEQELYVLRNNIINSDKLLEEKRESARQHDIKIINIQKALSEKLLFIHTQSDNAKELMQRERGVIQKTYEDRVSNIKAKYAPKINSLIEEISTLQDKFDEAIADTISSIRSSIYIKEVDLTNLTNQINTSRNEILTLQKNIAEKQATFNRLQFSKDTLVAKEAEQKLVQREISDRNFLIRAFDKTGIPVLKLENAGVPITKTANEFLEFFENKFRIAMQTVEWTEDRKKLKEVFDINVIGPSRSADIRKKSGGEQIWVETALQLALIFYQKERGVNIPAIFLDERDGALSAGNAKHFIEMIENAHQRIGVYNTFLITHRQELLELIPQQIILEDGKVTVRNETSTLR